MTPPTGLRHAFSSLRHRDFALLWSAGLVSNSGTWMQAVTVPYVLYHLTGSTTWIGISAFVGMVPGVLTGPVAGALADRFPRRAVLLVTQTVQMVTATSLWLFWVTGLATPVWILVHLFVSGVAGGVNIASWQAFVPQLVPRASLLNAVRLNTMQFTVARAAGPAAAGLVLAHFGAGTAFLGNAVSFVLVIAALSVVRSRGAAPAPTTASVLGQFREGLAHVAARPAFVVPVVAITILSLFGSSLVQLAPAMADEFGVGEAGYGMLVAVFGAGSIIGALVMGGYAERSRRSRTALGGMVLFAAAVLALAAAPVYAMGLAALLVMGVAWVVVSVSLNTSIQARVHEAYRGRVVSLYLMGLMAGTPVGALIEGRLADVIGLRPTIALAGVALLAFTAGASARYQRLAPLDEDLQAEELDVDPSVVISSGAA